MQARQQMFEVSSKGHSRDAGHPLRVVIAYGDHVAGKRAIRVMTDLAKGRGDAVELHPIAWSFNLLADLAWSEVAAADAVSADILIIATSSPDPLPAAVGRWAERAISRKQGAVTTVLALFGTEEHPDGTGSVRLAAIQAAVRQAGLDFFAPGPRHEQAEANAHLHRCVEEFTPVLDELLHPQPRAPLREQDA